LSLGKIYVCGIGLLCYLTYFHFWKFLAGRYILLSLKTKHHMIRRSLCKRKAEPVHSDIVGYYPRSKLP